MAVFGSAERRTLAEAVRAATLTVHAAAGLARCADQQTVRLLRASEGLCRSALAVLLSAPPETSPQQPHASRPDDAPAGDAGPVASAANAARRSLRWRRTTPAPTTRQRRLPLHLRLGLRPRHCRSGLHPRLLRRRRPCLRLLQDKATSTTSGRMLQECAVLRSCSTSVAMALVLR